MSALPSCPSLPSSPPPGAGEAAIRLLEGVLQARDSADAARRLADRLAETQRARRVGVGLWLDGEGLRLVALSHTPSFDAGTDEAQALAGALAEALDQGDVRWCAVRPDARDVGTAFQWELNALQARVGGTVAALPLGLQGQPVGAVVLEWDDLPHGLPDRLASLGETLGLAAPMLRLWTVQALPWHRRMRLALSRAWHGLRQPARRTQRRALGLGAALLGVLAAWPVDHAVGGKARIEGEVQRVLTAPTDGFIKGTHVRPGDRVRAGDLLAEMVDRDLALAQTRWRSERAQHESAYAAAMARADRAAAAVSLARMGEAEAQLGLTEQQLERSRITAPFDGLVIEGDLSQSAGAPVKQGERLLTLAADGPPRVVVEVDESEIADVRPGQVGRLRVSAWPWEGQDIVVERITPLARAVEGRNVFDVQARLRETPAAEDAALRPGLQGQARLVVGRAPWLLAWATHGLRRVRAALWSVGV